MGTNVKLSCSLKWLCRILSENFSLEDLEEKRLLPKGAIQRMFLEPYSHGRLNKGVIELLTDPSIYLSAYVTIHSGGKVEEDSFECLIHNLAKKGGYILEDNDTVVNGSMLAQKAPFREASHLALLDVLMVQYASKIITVERTVKAARRIFSFNSSKELPSKPDVELLLMIWLNKVAQAVNEEQSNRMRRRRRKRSGIPTLMGDLCCGLKDGKNLALLLIYYDPDSFSWNDFDLDSDSPVVEREALKNIQAVFNYCNSQFAPHTFHILPTDFLQWAESGLLKCNILACLAHLFYSFEIMQAVSSLRVPSISKHLSSQLNILHSASESALTRRKRKEWLQPGGRGTHHVRMGCSRSTKESGNDSELILPDLKKVSNSREKAAGSKFTTFKPPIRSSLNPMQMSVLAKLKTERGLPTEIRHSQSFPSGSRSLTSADHSSYGSKLCSPNKEYSSVAQRLNSTDAADHSCSSLGDSKPCALKEAKIGSSNGAQTLNVSDAVDQSSPSSCEPKQCSPKEVRVHSSSSGDPAASTINEDKKELSTYQAQSHSTVNSSKEGLVDSHISSSGSFTVHKRHTFSSATAAGLPVVDGNYSCASEKKKTVFQVHSADQPSSDDHKNTILLTNFLELHHSYSQENLDWKCSPAVEFAVPASVQKFRNNLMPVLASLNSKDSAVEARVEEICRVFSQESLGKIKSSTDIRSSDMSTTPHKEGSGKNPVKKEPASLKNENASSIHGNAQDYVWPQSKPVSELPGLGCRKITASLEQFERDELLAQQSATPVSMSDNSGRCKLPTAHSHSRQHYVGGQALTSHSTSQRPLDRNMARSHNGRTYGSQGAACDSNGCVPASHSNSGACVGNNVVAGMDKEGSMAKTSMAHRSSVSPRSCGRLGRKEFECQNRGTALEGNKTVSSNCRNQMGISTDGLSSNQVHLVNTNKGQSVDENIAPIMSSGYRDSVARTNQLHSSSAAISSHMESDQDAAVDDMAVPNDKSAKLSNPWMPPLHQDGRTPLQKRKERRIKQLLEERHLARKSASVKTKTREKSTKQHGDSVSRPNHVTLKEGTQTDEELAKADVSQMQAKSATYLEYSGPNCYIKPKSKTNIQIVRNAICSVCLAGEVNNTLKKNVLKVLEGTAATHILILFRDRIGFKFRGIYSFYPGERHISRICGTGPREIKDTMIGALYKYNSGQKEFKEIPSRSFSVSVDGVTIKSECWLNAKRKSSAKGQLL